MFKKYVVYAWLFLLMSLAFYTWWKKAYFISPSLLPFSAIVNWSIYGALILFTIFSLLILFQKI